MGSVSTLVFFLVRFGVPGAAAAVVVIDRAELRQYSVGSTGTGCEACDIAVGLRDGKDLEARKVRIIMRSVKPRTLIWYLWGREPLRM